MVLVSNEVDSLHFLTISYFFWTPRNCSFLEFHCSFEVLHLEKLETIIFQIGEKNVLLGKIIFPFGTIIFSIFPHEKIEKVKKMFCYHNCPDLSFTVWKICSSVILTFFRVHMTKKSKSQKHYKFEAEGQEFAKLFFLASVPWKKVKITLEHFFSHSRSEQLW